MKKSHFNIPSFLQISIGMIILTAAVSVSAQDPPAVEMLAKQEQRKSDYLLKVTEFIHAYDKKNVMFKKWICLGKTSKFRERLNQQQVGVDVNPNLGPMAEYRPLTQIIVIQAEPNEFFWSIGFDGRSSFLLWHEAVHAISHGHQIGAIKPSHPLKGVPTDLAPKATGEIKHIDTAEEMIDHYYINWAEACVAGLAFLERFDDLLRANGKSVPSVEVQAQSQRLWTRFVENCNESIYGQLPNEAERKELERMIGFHFDVNEIMNGYLDLGYPIEYFCSNATDAQIWGLFPTATQVGATGLKEKKEKNKLKDISATYIKSWEKSPAGRDCEIHLTLFGSEEIAKAVWDAAYGANPGNRTAVPGVGDEAYLIDRKAGNSYHGITRFRNAHVLIMDMEVEKADKDGLSVKRLPINWNFVKIIFKNMENLGIPAIPAGVETSIDKLRNSP